MQNKIKRGFLGWVKFILGYVYAIYWHIFYIASFPIILIFEVFIGMAAKFILMIFVLIFKPYLDARRKYWGLVDKQIKRENKV